MRLDEGARELAAASNPGLPLDKFLPGLRLPLSFVHIESKRRDLLECLLNRVIVRVRSWWSAANKPLKLLGTVSTAIEAWNDADLPGVYIEEFVGQVEAGNPPN